MSLCDIAVIVTLPLDDETFASAAHKCCKSPFRGLAEWTHDAYMSTTLRQLTLRLVKSLGVRQFRSRSWLDLPFIVHLGDSFGETPYYNLRTHLAELLLMAAWCRQVEQPVILDIGGHVGFIATQVAQLLEDKHPQIYSFEPVPYTFKRLFDSVHLLDLEHLIKPICCALSNKSGLVQLSYSEWDSMFAQVLERQPNQRVGDKVACSNALTLDQVVEFIGSPPDLIKVDAEGHEVQIFKGGRNVLSNQPLPAICFELNPLTLCESGSNAVELQEQICRYDFYYISDFEHQRMGIGAPIVDLRTIDWVCNIFGVPKTKAAYSRWRIAIEEVTGTLVRSADSRSTLLRFLL